MLGRVIGVQLAVTKAFYISSKVMPWVEQKKKIYIYICYKVQMSDLTHIGMTRDYDINVHVCNMFYRT